LQRAVVAEHVGLDLERVGDGETRAAGGDRARATWPPDSA
jgi:hypothetical protein